MSVVGIVTAVSAGAALVGKGYAGAQAMGVDSAGAVDALKEVSMAEKAHTRNTIDLKRRQADRKFGNLMKSATAAGSESLYKAFKSGQSVIGGQDFAGSGEAVQDATRVVQGVQGKYRSTIDNMVEELKTQKTSIDLNKQSELAKQEKRMESSITQVLATPDTFMEGFTGTGDYQIK